MFTFKVLKNDESTNARLGEINTAHGVVETPAFMPVATHATVKSMTSEEIEDMGFRILIANAYHLYLRPGHKTIEKMGGLHKFMSWDHTITTDSGGYQVLSLSQTRKIKSDGVVFRSHLDGSEHYFTPKKCIEIQESLGVEIMMCLDECPPYPSTKEYMEKSIKLTTNWAKLCRESKTRTDNALFGIVQGGVYQELRKKSAQELMEIGFEGYALGGLGIGEDPENTYDAIEGTLQFLPLHKPRYLMGLGKPEDIVIAVSMGVDIFDCVIPTRNARNGTLFTSDGKLVIKNAQFAEDERPIDEGCECYTCRTFSRAYLRHLYLAKETLVLRLLTLHNLYYYSQLMKEIRDSIRHGNFPNLLSRVKSIGGY